MKRSSLIFSLVALALFSLTERSSAQFLVNVQFQVNASGDYNGGNLGAYTGPGVLGTGNETWNEVNGGTLPTNGSPGIFTSTTSTDATGKTSTGVTLSVGTGASFSGTGHNGAASTSPAVLLDQFATTGGASGGKFSFGGLTAGTYNLVLFGENGSFDSSSITLTAGTNSGAVVNTAGTDTSFTAGVNYVEFTGISISGTTLSGTFAGTNGGEGDFNGAELQLVPEPTTWAMLLGGLAALIGLQSFRRRLNS